MSPSMHSGPRTRRMNLTCFTDNKASHWSIGALLRCYWSVLARVRGVGVGLARPTLQFGARLVMESTSRQLRRYKAAGLLSSNFVLFFLSVRKRKIPFFWRMFWEKVDYYEKSSRDSWKLCDSEQSSVLLPSRLDFLAVTHRSLSVPGDYFSPEPELPCKARGPFREPDRRLWLSHLGPERPRLLILCPEYHVWSAW